MATRTATKLLIELYRIEIIVNQYHIVKKLDLLIELYRIEMTEKEWKDYLQTDF